MDVTKLDIDKTQLKNCKILVVDDEEIFRSYVLQTLQGFSCFSVENGKTAIEVFTEKLPDITFLDINLPDKSGQDLLVQFKQIKPNAYIIMLSGNKTQTHVKLAMQNGASGYIIKPFNQQQIHKFVEYYLKVNKRKFQPK